MALASYEDRALARRRTDGGNADARGLEAHLVALRKRVAVLDERDRILIDLVAGGHKSLRDVARLLSTDPGTLSRRFRTLWRKLHDPLVLYLFDPRCALAPEIRQVGIERHLVGLSVAAIADRHRLSLREVKSLLAYLRGFAAAHPPLRPPP